MQAKLLCASVKSVGGLAQTNLEWVLWKEFGRQRGYGSHKTIFPQNSRNTQKRLAEKKKSVYICEIRGRLFYARSFCVFCEIRGRLFSARSFCVFCEFCGRTCANKLGVGSVEGIQRAAWVWQGCHTLLLL